MSALLTTSGDNGPARLTRVIPALLLLSTLSCHASAAAQSAAVVYATGPDVTAAEIARHVHALADDAMAGRATGSAESLAAAAYLEGVLRDAGLRGAGDGGSFLQTTDTRRFTSDGVPTLEFFTVQRPAMDADLMTAADAGVAPSGMAAVTAAPGADFAYRSGGPVDATLALVIAATAADVPKTPRADAALYLPTGGRTARSWLSAAGAPDGRGWGLLLLAGDDTAGTPDEQPVTGLLTAPADQPLPPTSFTVRGPLRDRLAAGEFAGLRAALRAAALVPAVNVVGVLDGAGTPDHPELARQAVVFTAHYDHLGVARNADDVARLAAGAVPDLIYNGADDDASGCAAVLELAQAFGAEARAGRPPARTLVFLLVTGEEVGLIGTRYYLDHPVVPLAETVCNLNFEMIGRPDALVGGAGKLWLTGFERSNLGPAWAGAGLDIAPDARPEEHFFERSDNIAFVMRGIVGQTLSSYNLHEDYHHVTDAPDTLDFLHMETAVRAGLAAARTLADGTLTPAWIGPPPAPPARPGAPAAPGEPASPSAPAAEGAASGAPGGPR